MGWARDRHGHARGSLDRQRVLAQAYRPLNATLLLVWILVGVGYGEARARSPAEASAPPTGQEGLACCAGAGVVPHTSPLALLLPSSRPVGVVFWLAVLAAGVFIDLVARRSEGRLATAEEVVRFVSTARLANVALGLPGSSRRLSPLRTVTVATGDPPRKRTGPLRTPPRVTGPDGLLSSPWSFGGFGERSPNGTRRQCDIRRTGAPVQSRVGRMRSRNRGRKRRVQCREPQTLPSSCMPSWPSPE